MRKQIAIILIVLVLAALACQSLSFKLPTADGIVGTLLATNGLEGVGEMATLLATSGMGDEMGSLVETMMASGTLGISPLETMQAELGGIDLGIEGAVILEDDFSNPDSGWDRTTDAEFTTDYDGGAYRIYVGSESYSAWANPNQSSYGDVSIQVDANKAAGPDDNEFGLICRHSDPSNYYVATISSDGFYGFLRRVAGADLELIGMDSMQPSDAINLGAASNHIRLDCIGSTLTLYANGTLLGSVTDSNHLSGDVGLYAGTFSEGGADILFDNFVVTAP
jgi:hypothetical protein